MEVTAKLNSLHIAPRKVRLLASLVNGMEVASARRTLEHTGKRSGVPLCKLLESAVANAAHNFQLEEKTLYIKSARVDGGPVLKRFRPRAFGRAAMIRKRTSHVTLVLATRDDRDLKIKSRKEKPIIRAMESGDLETTDFKKIRGRREKETSSPKSIGFKQRMFRRKAI